MTRKTMKCRHCKERFAVDPRDKKPLPLCRECQKPRKKKSHQNLYGVTAVYQGGSPGGGRRR